MEQKATVLRYLQIKKLGVLSSVNEKGMPEAALVGFGETPQLHLVFGTYSNSRKYKNILANPHVAFTVGDESKITVQLEGKAYELSEKELNEYTSPFFKKNPAANANPKEKYFKIVPTWIRYSNYNTKEIFEMTL